MIDDGYPPLVVIVGPTGVGKTALAVEVASSLGGEIVSADSRQIYRYMDIGTAKPTAGELSRVRHHLVDILEPDQVLTVAEFKEMACRAIDEVHRLRKLPFLVGGTGQYIRAVVQGWSIPPIPPQHDMRADLEGFSEVYGAGALHGWLSAQDPVGAERIDPRNVRRVVRALEVHLLTGTQISRLQTRQPPPYRVLQIGLTRPRHILYRRVDSRLEAMLEAGMVEEVRRLRRAGYGPALPSMSSLGYPQISAYLEGEIDLDTATALIRQATRRFIRHQYTWFRPGDPGIRWFDLEQSGAREVLEAIQNWLG